MFSSLPYSVKFYMLAYIDLNGSPNFSKKGNCSKDEYNCKSLPDKDLECYTDPFISQSMEIKASSLDILD